jgi:cytochrome o ubiquinol oxidase operon protein cyoD
VAYWLRPWPRLVASLAFGVLIVLLVLVGSLVIMTNLNENMVTHTELMNLQMQH